MIRAVLMAGLLAAMAGCHQTPAPPPPQPASARPGVRAPERREAPAPGQLKPPKKKKPAQKLV